MLCITNNSIKHQSFIYTLLNLKAVLFLTIQFSISTLFSSIWPIDRILSDATIPAPNGPASDGKKGVLRIPQRSSITGTSPSDCLVPYPGLSCGGHTLYRYAVGVFYSPSRLGHGTLIREVLSFCRDAVGVFYSPSRPGQAHLVTNIRIIDSYDVT